MLLNIEKIKGLWDKLLHQEATPHQIAMGFCIGLFVSFFPIIPLQTVTTILFAFLFRSNKVASLIGLHVHLLLAPFVPLLFLLEYKIGYKLLDWHHHPRVDADHITILYLIHKGWPILRAMLIGAAILAIPSSILTYPIIRQATFRWQETRRKSGATKKNNDDVTSI